MKPERVAELMNKYVDLLTFQEGCAEEIRETPEHDSHNSHFNERYWHGFAAALRYARDTFKDRFQSSVPTTIKEENQ